MRDLLGRQAPPAEVQDREIGLGEDLEPGDVFLGVLVRLRGQDGRAQAVVPLQFRRELRHRDLAAVLMVPAHEHDMRGLGRAGGRKQGAEQKHDH